MARPRNIHSAVPLRVRLPLPTRAKLDLYLFSQVEGCVPKGAYTKFITSLIEDFFRKEPPNL
mgnify:CR=1 FL=1